MNLLSGDGRFKEQLASYLGSFREFGLARLVKIAGLVAAGSIAEGFGIVLLIPMLGLVFAKAQTGAASAGIAGSGIRALLAPIAPSGQLAIMLALFVAILALRGIIAWRRDFELMRLSVELVAKWRERIVRAVATASWSRVREMQHSQLEFAVTSEVGRLSMGSDRMLAASGAALQLMLLLAVALYLSPWLTLLALASVLCAMPLLLPLVRESHRHGEQLSRDGGKKQNLFSEFLAGMKLAKAHDAEHRYAGDFVVLGEAMIRRGLAFTNVYLRNQHAFQLAGGIAAAVIVYVGLAVLHTAPAVLAALLVLLTRIIGPVQQLAQAAQSIATMLPAVGHLTGIEAALATEPDVAQSNRQARVAEGPAGFSFEVIEYSPPGRNKSIYSAIECEIAPGSLAVLLGSSGIGKTTLADMLLGLIEPSQGQIEIGGIVLRDAASRAEARSRIAYVPQDPFLFDLSLRDNLLWADPDANEAQLWQALEQAEAADFVRRIPEGLDAPVGQRGSRLSGGERQRICLARALLRKPGLLILDEATSALDPVVEERLLQTLIQLRGTMTLLIIAHRLPSWFPADAILTLRDGTLLSQTGSMQTAGRMQIGR